MPSSESRSDADRRQPLTVRFALQEPSGLDRLLHATIAGEPAEGVETCFLRDIYFDTPEDHLASRDAWCRLRLDAHGGLTLSLRLPAGDGEHHLYQEELPAGTAVDPDEIFAASTEVSYRLRALTDPASLVAAMEMEIERRVRTLVLDGGAEGVLIGDAATVRAGDQRGALFEAEVTLPPGIKGRRRLLRGLERDYALIPVYAPDPERARRALTEASVDLLEEAVRSARRLAVVAFADGCVALRSTGRELRVATGEGTGEDAARRVLRSTWEQSAIRIRLLGMSPGSLWRPATEVWIADAPGGPLVPRGEANVTSVPLADLLDAVGSPALRDDATLAALAVLARSDLPLRPGASSPPPLVPAPEPLPPEGGSEIDLPSGSLLNMELSALAFNRRVLALASDPANPLSERVRFLAIFSANIDEFFRVRVAGFKRQVAEGSVKRTLDGATPEKQLDAISVRCRRLEAQAYALLHDTLLPELRRHGVQVVHAADLPAEDRVWLDDYHERNLHSVLTPLSAGPGHPFPHIRNLRPALAAILHHPRTGSERIAIVELPSGLPRFVPLPGGGRYVALEEIISMRLDALYPGHRVLESGVFRVTRSAELHLRGRSEEDLLHAVQEEVTRRRYRPAVRLEVEVAMPERLRELLVRELRYEAADRASTLTDGDVYAVPAPIDLSAVRELAVLEGEGFTYPPLQHSTPIPEEKGIFEALREREWLLSFPGDSFEATVERFIREAARDRDVLAIKLALYRTNPRSGIVQALRRASAAGKQVVALVELTARFDEERNIAWARYLRRHGIHVIFGAPGTKVHAKIALVVRREGGEVRRYAYVGTGNLNAQTATAYTDLGLLTADADLTAEVAEVFNHLTSGSGEPELAQLLVSPFNLRRGFLERIHREAEHARAGRGGHIRAKFNGLADREVVAALYDASRAGVRVDLIVRSLCVLRPGVPGLSENIRVRSILGRHLEHGRIFRFSNGGEPEYLIGSADWRTRNLSRRVEVVAPVRDPDHQARLDSLLEEQWTSPEAWELGSDGTYYQKPELPPQDRLTFRR